MKAYLSAASLAAAAIALLCGCAPAHSTDQRPRGEPVAWVQYGPLGPEVRAAADAAGCPTAMVDDKPIALTVRVGADENFPTLCRADLVGARHVRLGPVDVTLPGAAPRRIVVIGDTGCRVKGLSAQACDNPRAWPFATVARAAAALAPDLVIHVGDYLYRETPCPTTEPACSGSPHGDRWATWRADFLDPAEPLLDHAPILLARGNHEDCKRAGAGYERLFFPGPAEPGCRPFEAPWVAALGDLALAVFDSSAADDRFAPPKDVAQLQAGFDALGARLAQDDLKGKTDFLITHKPIWAFVPVARLVPGLGLDAGVNRSLQLAARGHMPGPVAMVVSGHIHHFAVYDFGGVRPAQLVAGESGSAKEDVSGEGFDHQTRSLDGLTPTRLSFSRYGFVVLDRTLEGYDVTPYDENGKPILTCKQTGRRLICP